MLFRRQLRTSEHYAQIVVLYIRREGNWKDNYITTVLQGNKISQHYKGTHGTGAGAVAEVSHVALLITSSKPRVSVSTAIDRSSSATIY
ncbi:hypothetical protein BDA96_10G240800 [Sorghum bicolor]|uniref:Uncharacterized protein n=2 Tax=Sorghum bicolor TaxID=4558 RepID=C5Z5L5_SORBI|nr:hypothetical protein SORBI_3010G183300 [Sorghum bicolor]KAG0514998.1 hypothetical protein BDA96_10G240800 [Sorghum bicolor]